MFFGGFSLSGSWCLLFIGNTGIFTICKWDSERRGNFLQSTQPRDLETRWNLHAQIYRGAPRWLHRESRSGGGVVVLHF